MKTRKLLSIFLSIVMLISVLPLGALPVFGSEIVEYLLGDVNGDLIVSAADARLALRMAVGLESYEEDSREFLAANVDWNGVITAADARIILRKAIDLENFAGDGYIVKSLSELPSIYNDSESYFDLCLKEYNDDYIIVTIVAKNCIGLKSADLIIEYDGNLIAYYWEEEGTDAANIKLTKSNSLMHYLSSETNAILKYSLCFSENLWDSDTFAADAQIEETVDINSESFELFDLWFTTNDKYIDKLNFSIDIKSIEGIEATSITKQFNIEQNEHIHEWNIVEVKPATCADEGIEFFTCIVCGETKNESIPATGNHIDNNSDGLCDVCGVSVEVSGDVETDGGETKDVCKYCGKVHSDTFADRLIIFFHKIAYFFAHLLGIM